MTQDSRERTPVSFLRVCLFSLLILGVIVGFFLLIRDQQQRVVYTDLVGPAVDILATAFLLVAAVHAAARSKRLALAWGAIGLASLLFALGDIVWTILELVLEVEPFPSIADGLYLAYYPAFLVGVILLTNRPARPSERFKNALDLVTILAVAILGFWNFLIGPMIQLNAGTPFLEQAILLAYPVGDMVLLGALLLIVYDESREIDLVMVFFLAGGLVLTIIADGIFSYEALQDTYVSGSLLDLVWLAANLLIGLAGASQWAGRRYTRPVGAQLANPNGGRQAGSAFRGRLGTIRMYFPYVWLVGALVLLITSGLTPLPMSTLSLSLGVAVIMLLVLVRQLITLLENRQLNAQLHAQAELLKGTNQDLSTEIMERERMQAKLSYDTLHDGMTGLANRFLFLDRLGQAIEGSKRNHDRRFAVLFMDLDQFKVVNDSLGHTYGDQLLISVAKRLRETVRSTDTIARFGGDEFAVLCEDSDDGNSARALAGRIQAAMRPAFGLKDGEVYITASIGIAANTIRYDRAEDLLRDADLAMYQAKALGAGRSEMFLLEMRDQPLSRLETEQGLRGALERREFQLYYQPINSLASDKVVGFEALLRWRHPTKGLLLPGEFLPAAEASGLILLIGDWVLHEACRQLRTWRDRFPYLRGVSVSVNLSDRQFSQPDLAEEVARALSASGLEGPALRLEITERVLVGNSPVASRIIKELQDLGVQLQIDDFGTGFSALSFLQQFPLDALKIDRAFISQMLTGRKSLGLVRAIISMAHDLGMHAIAEGIETGEQLKELKDLACGFGQGFLLSAPMDAASIEEGFLQVERASRA
ncbi:MAG: EAL domain-containing protein [Chloroflexota bacterium]